MEVYDHFSVFSKRAGALNQTLEFIEVEGNNFFKYVPTKWLSLIPAIEKMLKCSSAIAFKVWDKKNILL